jgi:hypothetical protein
MYGDEYDDDDQATMSEDEDLEDQDDTEDQDDEDEGDGTPPDDDALISEVCELLRDKMGVDLPADDLTPESFLRDLCMALHGHPGHDFGGDDQAPAAQMSAGRRRRKRKRKQMSQPRRQPTSRGVSATRGKAAAEEIAKNCGLAK